MEPIGCDKNHHEPLRNTDVLPMPRRCRFVSAIERMLAEYRMGVNIALNIPDSSRCQLRDINDEFFPSAWHGLAGKSDRDFMRGIGFRHELFGRHLTFFPPQI